MYASVVLKDICSTEPVCVTPGTPVSDVLRTMHARRISSAVVVEGTRPVGIFTERDAMKVFAHGPQTGVVPVNAVMGTPPLVAPLDIGFFEAYHLCAQKGVRHLIVVDGTGDLYGIASDTDFMRVLGLDVLSGQEKVEQVMAHAPMGISRQATLNEAVAMMVKFKSQAVVAVDHGKPIGILTERDVVRLGRGGTAGTAALAAIMTTPVLTITADRSIYHAIEVMREKTVRTLVVVDAQGQFVGLLSEHDVVEKIESRYVSVLTTIIQRQSDDIDRIRHELDEKHVLSAVLHQSLGVGLVVADPTGKVHYMNPAAAGLFDLHPARASGTALPDLFASAGLATTHLQPAFDAAGQGGSYEYDLGHHDGQSHRELHVRMAPIQDQDGRFLGMVQAIQDVTDRNLSERKLKQAASIFENTIEGVIVADAQANILSVNPAFCRITGYLEDEVRGRNPRMLGSGRQDRVFYERMWKTLLSTGYWQGEVWNRRKNGEAYAEWLTVNVIKDAAGKPHNYIAVFADITSAKRVHDEFEFLAHHDPLTRLPNRLLFNARLTHSLSRSIRARTPIAVLMVDLDGFKWINDHYGHAAGDRVLEIVGSRLATHIRGEDTVARLGGDEFAIVLEDLETDGAATDIAHKLIQAIATPIDLSRATVSVTGSIGIAFSTPSEKSPADLLRSADEALYLAKNAGKNTCRIFARSHPLDSHA
ncbi:MAG: diguanylate cyclase [Burkholderiales bacterium]|nr:diguanylate cyclase [Burkholderiales bacterium]